ncbi:glycoside hydrolase superfamily [Desarmillaria tabescens]|uniref:glucan endo-1,3-beta-D-glucosidase n=1 Tax=Armillaria tabescens TaxID=1929756 RepID=A0AA39MWL6_ARMTA|nr:glycoside hydrolase superfamily [Desarmillaria tabescens]KAK0448908.1 glycoside hydrolase superfamily [Desarmillaria tabescens]
MPATPPSTTNNWWCDMNTEYAFVGFSYEVTACQDFNQLRSEFTDIRQRFNGRYVRIYGACTDLTHNDDVINAAWDAGVGIHALVWFGFDGGDIWKARRDTLFATLNSNPKAKFVTRVVQFGSEPLYDNVLSVDELAAQVGDAKRRLSSLGIPVTISELAYGYQARGGAKPVLDAVDLIDAHMLPFFSQQASTASASWPIVQNDLNWFVANGQGKKIYLSQNGWPSVTYQGVQPNSPNAVSDVQNESDYYKLLASKCSTLKNIQGGGVGWFAHIYSDAQEPGYGIYDVNGNLKFDFNPLTSC